MPLVSVIIPTYNRATLLKEAIESVLAVRRDGFELEIIVVDNGSTDDTQAVAGTYPVRYVRTQEGRGASLARNAGIHAARGDFLAFLDDDDLWLPDNIAPQLKLLAEHPEYGAVHAQAQLTDASRVPYGEPIPQGPLHSGWVFEDILRYWPQLGTIVVRAAVAREVGDFDPTLFADQDWDWILRITRRFQFGRIEQPVILFRQRGSEDDTLAWRRFPYNGIVFHRHTRDLPLAHRLRLQRIWWGHRGWYASLFLQNAQHYARQGEMARAWRSAGYACRASLPHAAGLVVKFWLLSMQKNSSSRSEQIIASEQ